MVKKQKVRFHKGDRRPGNHTIKDIHYRKKMIKHKGDIIWQVLEYPKKNVVAEYFFEEDAHNLCKFQNKHKVWANDGGIPKFLYINISK